MLNWVKVVGVVLYVFFVSLFVVLSFVFVCFYSTLINFRNTLTLALTSTLSECGVMPCLSGRNGNCLFLALKLYNMIPYGAH